MNNLNEDINNALFVLNVFEEADIVFEVANPWGNDYCISCFVKR